MSAWEARGESNEWYTPRYIFDALGVHFDLDVACPPEGPRHVPCDNWFCERALEREWQGFVWMNPPFGHQKHKLDWLRKFITHSHGIALLPDRTSAPWFQWAAPQMDAILFVSPKIAFERPDGTLGESPGTGTALMALGPKALAALKRARSLGLLVLPSIPREAA